MASMLSHLPMPHILHADSARNLQDPVHGAIFEVYFTLPEAIQSEFKQDEVLLTEQVTEVAGLDILQKTVQAGTQKFFGADASFLNPSLDTTYAEITITFNLNLREVTDNWVLKVFKAWGKLGYDMADGTRTIMRDYVADNLRIAEANRDGSIWRSYIFHKIMVTSITGLENLNYTDNEARRLVVQFRADYWEEDLA